MTSRERVGAAMRREPVDRIPTMPQLWHDMALRVYVEPGRDWIDGLARCIEAPSLIDDAVIRLAREARCDGLRIFIHPAAVRVVREGDTLVVLDRQTGAHAVEPLDPMGGVSVADAKKRIGARVALMGGVSTLLLAQGTPGEVRAEAVRVCREAGPGGYILAAGDMVPPVTPLANLRAMVDVARCSSWKRGE